MSKCWSRCFSSSRGPARGGSNVPAAIAATVTSPSIITPTRTVQAIVNLSMRRLSLNRIFIAIFLLTGCLIALKGQSRADNVTSPDGTLRRIRVPVLMYHYISVPPPDADVYRKDLSVTPDNFRAQMQWLKEKGYTTITPDELVAALTRGTKLPDHPVLLTFD